MSTLRSVLANHALRLIASRPHSSLELANKLSRVAYKKSSGGAAGRYRPPESGDEGPQRPRRRQALAAALAPDPDTAGMTPSEVARHVVDELVDVKAVNDKEFAEWFCKSRQDMRPRSLFVLRGELMVRGIGSGTIAAVVTGYCELTACRTLAERKPHMSNEALKAFLLQKKFPLEVVATVLHGRSVVDAASGLHTIADDSSEEDDASDDG